MTNPLGLSGGWIVAKRGALLTLSHVCDHLVTVEGLIGLGLALNRWARDPELYAVALDPSVLRLGLADVDPSAAAALAECSWRIECFSKPLVSLIDGEVGEVGLALALAGTHIVAGENFRFRCPSLARSRLPPGMVMVALARRSASASLARLQTDEALGPADALASGLVGFTIPVLQFPMIREALAAADPVDPVLDERNRPIDVNPNSVPHVQASPFAAIVADTVNVIRDLDVERALTYVFKVDQAISSLGVTATPAAISAAGSDVTIVLPTRRVLQDFRNA